MPFIIQFRTSPKSPDGWQTYLDAEGAGPRLFATVELALQVIVNLYGAKRVNLPRIRHGRDPWVRVVPHEPQPEEAA